LLNELLILDSSDEGALLKPSDTIWFPAKFVLKPRFGQSRNCVLVWRKGELVGVRFV